MFHGCNRYPDEWKVEVCRRTITGSLGFGMFPIDMKLLFQLCLQKNFCSTSSGCSMTVGSRCVLDEPVFVVTDHGSV